MQKPTMNAKTAIVPRLRAGSDPATSQRPAMMAAWHTSIHDRRCPSHRVSSGTCVRSTNGAHRNLKRRDQRDQAEEADHFEREPRGAEPRRQRVEDQEVRQPGREAQRDHDERGALGVHAKRTQVGAPGRLHVYVVAEVVGHACMRLCTAGAGDSDPGGRGAKLLAQLPLQDLARAGLGKAVEKGPRTAGT